MASSEIIMNEPEEIYNKTELFEFVLRTVEKLILSGTTADAKISGADANHDLLISTLFETIKTKAPNDFVKILESSMKCAVENEKIDFLQKIITNCPNADLHFEDEFLLRKACSQESADIVGFLLSKGAKVDVFGKHGNLDSALTIALANIYNHKRTIYDTFKECGVITTSATKWW